MPLPHIEGAEWEGAEWPSWRGHGQWASTRAARGCARGPPMTAANGGRPACGPPRRRSSGSRSTGSGGDGECAAPTSRGSSSPPAGCGLRPSVVSPRAASEASPARFSSSQTPRPPISALSAPGPACSFSRAPAPSCSGAMPGDDGYGAAGSARSFTTRAPPSLSG